MSCAKCFAYNGTIFKQPSFGVSNETSPIMVTHVLGEQLRKVSKRCFGSPSEKSHEKEQKKTKILDKKLQSFWHCTQKQKPLHEYYPAATETPFTAKLILDGKVQNSTLILNTKIYRKWVELQMKMCFLRQFSNLSKMGFSMKFLQLICRNFFAQMLILPF